MSLSSATTPQSDTAVSTDVVTSIAATTGKSMEALPPLYSVVDPDALDSLFDADRQNAMGVRVRFSFAGCTVEIDEGSVTVTEDEREGAAPSPTCLATDR